MGEFAICGGATVLFLTLVIIGACRLCAEADDDEERRYGARRS